MNEGPWPIGETERPEYETAASFGGMSLNTDAESVMKCNEICNRYGLDAVFDRLNHSLGHQVL